MFIEIIEELTEADKFKKQPMIVKLNIKHGSPQEVMNEQALKFAGKTYKEKMREGE